MKKLIYLLGIAFVFSACSNDNEGMEPEIETTPLTVGLDAQDNVIYFEGLSVLEFDNNPNLGRPEFTEVTADVNQDGINDFLFKLTTNLDRDTQLLEVEPINGAQLARQQEVLDASGSANPPLQLARNGQELNESEFTWTSGQSLFMLYRSSNSAISAASDFRFGISYIPVNINDKLGWVEFNATTEGPASSVSGIRIIETALFAGPIQ